MRRASARVGGWSGNRFSAGGGGLLASGVVVGMFVRVLVGVVWRGVVVVGVGWEEFAFGAFVEGAEFASDERFALDHGAGEEHASSVDLDRCEAHDFAVACEEAEFGEGDADGFVEDADEGEGEVEVIVIGGVADDASVSEDWREEDGADAAFVDVGGRSFGETFGEVPPAAEEDGEDHEGEPDGDDAHGGEGDDEDEVPAVHV